MQIVTNPDVKDEHPEDLFMYLFNKLTAMGRLFSMVVGVARTKSADHTSMHGIYEIIDDAANDMQDVFKKMCRMYDDLESRLVKIRAGLAGLSEQLYGEHQAEIKMTLAEDERGA